MNKETIEIKEEKDLTEEEKKSGKFVEIPESIANMFQGRNREERRKNKKMQKQFLKLFEKNLKKKGLIKEDGQNPDVLSDDTDSE